MPTITSSPSAHAAAPAASSAATPVAIARGDGIGPDIMEAVLHILHEAGARLELREIELGEKVYKQGILSGIEPSAWDVLRETGLLLKAPITTPRGKGYKSLNVTLRKSLGLYANVRPCRTFEPALKGRFEGIDLIIVRENEEDTYAGIEHRQTREVTQCLKLITRPGSERCIRYAFEMARQLRRKRVTCMVKDNIMKMTDGLFAQVFEQVAAEYPGIETDSAIIDIGTARVAERPQDFDVIVTPNLYGDIISDVAAQVAGSVGMCGSANIGENIAMFEAIHGSAPDIAGQDKANPSALLQAALMLLEHIGQGEVAHRVELAWLKALEDGLRTGDIARGQPGEQLVGTKGFAEGVIARLGQQPAEMSAPPEISDEPQPHTGRITAPAHREVKELVGVDVFLDWDEQGRDAEVLAARLQALVPASLKLKMITNRGVKVWPEGLPETFRTDHWRCRFVSGEGSGAIDARELLALLGACVENGLDVIKTENLYTFDGAPGYSLGQGE